MSEWVRLNARELSDKRRHETTRQGLDFVVFVSPHDVPEAVRGHYDEALKRFVIEFSYLDEERWKRRKQDEYVTFRIGRHSSRLYGIEVDVPVTRTRQVSLRVAVAAAVDDALKQLTQQPDAWKRRENYEVAQTAISTSSEQLFQGVSAG